MCAKPWLAIAFSLITLVHAKEEITFPSEDQLEITADIYAPHKNPKTPFIILFHQAGFSRGAYKGIAPKLNRLGYNCMAVDARSGLSVKKMTNLTAERARKLGKSTQFEDALPDLMASVTFARKKHAKGPLVIWGSSYSARLIFPDAAAKPKEVSGVIAFSANFSRRKADLDAAKKVTVPVFMTSAKHETGMWEEGFKQIPSTKKIAFIPQKNGSHGAKVLWKSQDNNREYWKAIKAFLTKYFPVSK